MPADTTPIPIAIPDSRAALARMYIDLTLAFHATTFPLNQSPTETDANLALVAVAVMLGHAEGRPMTATCVAASLHMPRSSVLARLNVLMTNGLIRRVKGRYYLTPDRALLVPHRDTFELILAQAFTILGPHLSESDD